MTITTGSDAADADAAGHDPVARAALLARVRDAFLSGDDPGRGGHASPREVVSASWRRSLRARVDPDRGVPRRVFSDGELDDVRADHPLAPVLPMLRGTLLEIADEAEHVMIVTDADGDILWREGHAAVLRRADDAALVEGTRWSEDAMGTNAMGTSLASDRAVQIHSSEHLVDAYRTWTCAASPIHHPETGELVGAVDLTGPVRSFHPSTLALVGAAARLAEHHLAARRAALDERLRARNLPHLAALGGPGALLNPYGRVVAATPHGWVGERVALPEAGSSVVLDGHGEGVLEPLAQGWLLRLTDPGPGPRPGLVLPFLGAERPVARLDGRPVRLSLRHAEMLAVLAMHPDGLTADRLADAVHGEHGNPVTVRSEVHRLRAALGAPVISTQPYRLRAAVDADFLVVRDDLRAGRVPAPDVLRRGALLPASEAPGVRAEREHLEAAVRRTVLARGDADALCALAATESGRHDTELAERLRRVVPAGDPRLLSSS